MNSKSAIFGSKKFAFGRCNSRALFQPRGLNLLNPIWAPLFRSLVDPLPVGVFWWNLGLSESISWTQNLQFLGPKNYRLARATAAHFSCPNAAFNSSWCNFLTDLFSFLVSGHMKIAIWLIWTWCSTLMEPLFCFSVNSWYGLLNEWNHCFATLCWKSERVENEANAIFFDWKIADLKFSIWTLKPPNFVQKLSREVG